MSIQNKKLLIISFILALGVVYLSALMPLYSNVQDRCTLQDGSPCPDGNMSTKAYGLLIPFKFISAGGIAGGVTDIYYPIFALDILLNAGVFYLILRIGAKVFSTFKFTK